MSLSERIRPNVEAAPWVCDEVLALEDRLHTANEKVGRYADQRDQLAGLLQMIASRGLSPVLTEDELGQIDATLASLQAVSA